MSVVLCAGRCPPYDTSIGQNSRVGPRAGVEDETNTNTLCRFVRSSMLCWDNA